MAHDIGFTKSLAMLDELGTPG